VQLGALTNWASVGSSTFGMYAIKNDGTMWGTGLYAGDGIATYRSSPVQVSTGATGGTTTWFGNANLYSSANGGAGALKS